MGQMPSVDFESGIHDFTMLGTPAQRVGLERGALIECIEACFECAQTCIACADACLGEGDFKLLARCIRRNSDCADVCNAVGAVMSRQTFFDVAMARVVLEASRTACSICAAECEEHEDEMDYCRICAEACRRCETSCERLLSSLEIS